MQTSPEDGKGRVGRIVSRIKAVDWNTLDREAGTDGYAAPNVSFDPSLGKGAPPNKKSDPRAPDEPSRSYKGVWNTSTGKRRSFI